MGSLFKSKSSAVIDPGAQEAWNLAKPFHQSALGGLNTLATQVQQNPAYAGQRVASLNPFQTGAADSLGNFVGNTSGLGQNFINTGMGNLNAGAGVGSNAQMIFNQAGMDPTQMIIDQAGMYANNPYVNGMIDAAGRDTVRALTEQQLPSLARSFAGTGNTNSTRAGVESAIAERGANDRLADIASGIRGQFFGRGLDMAQNQFNQNLTNMMSANQGLQQAGGFGADLINAGQGVAGTNFSQGLAAGGLYQSQNQAELDASKAYFDESIANPLSVYQALSGAAGNTQAKTAAGVSTQPSIASQLAALGQAAAGGYGSYKSDIRVKENITKVGALPSGLSLYEFEYKPEFKDKAGYGRFVGVMAQEAKEFFPDAVSMEEDGYYAVDYSKIN